VTRVTFVSPEPTPYRSPLLDRVAARQGIDLTVIYAARTVAGRTWTVEPRHRAVFLDGVTVPGLRGVLRHDYPVTPGIWRALGRSGPDCVVVSGWSTFPSQVAIGWCRLLGVPYVLLVESHDAAPKAGWRRWVKETVVPAVVGEAASVLVTGSLARESVTALGAAPERVRVFANTIDVEGFGYLADRVATRRDELRAGLGLVPDDVAVVSVSRLAPEKGVDVLLRAAAGSGLAAIVVGDGPERGRLERLGRGLGTRVVFTGDQPLGSVVEAYVAADGLPLVLSDRVGAAADLLRDGENGVLVPAGDVEAAAAALGRLGRDPGLRERMGARSRELVQGFGYEPSVDNLLAAVREATASR